MASDRLYLLDGSSLLYRAYYALLRSNSPGLRTRDGRPTGAVYGFLNTVRKLLADHRPEYVGIAFDAGVRTVRHEAFPAYKAHRKPMPEELAEQVPWVHRAVAALRIPLVIDGRYEADDVIGTLAYRAAEAGVDVIVVSGDKDLYQLLGPRVRMLQVRTSETVMVTDVEVPERFGVRPEQVPHVLALWGDSSDNIPGVRGIGEKGAKELIARHGDLDGVYRALDSMTPGRRRFLEQGEAQARLSLALATIRTDLAIDLDLDALRLDAPDAEALLELCRELELDGLARALVAPRPVQIRTSVAASVDEVAELVTAASTAERVALAPRGDPPTSIGLSHRSGVGVAVPIAGSDEAVAMRAALAPLLADPDVAKVGFDLKASARALAALGLELSGLAEDVGLQAYMLDPSAPANAPERLAHEILGRAALADAGPRQDELPLLDDPTPSAERAELALALADALKERLAAQPALQELYEQVERPLLPVLLAMERTGIAIDTERLADLGRRLDEQLATLTERIHTAAGKPFNISSPRQLAEVLFEDLGLETVKKTRRSQVASTDTEVLEELEDAHELPRLVLEYRELKRLLGGWVSTLPGLRDPADERVHTTFHQTVAATGRLTSTAPNLQNIPVRGEWGPSVRHSFVAPPGRELLAADYSQIELRVLAHLSADPELVAAFRDGADVHRRTAARVFGMAEELVPAELRRRAKVINFGIIYGMSAFGLARRLAIPKAEAKQLIDEYFARYAGVRAWLDATIEAARSSRRVRTLYGRERPVPEIRSGNRADREHAERIAVNTPIQGTAADLIKMAMIRIDRRLREERLAAALLLQVHDELVLECDQAAVPEIAALVREELEGVAELRVPLVASIGHGASWLEAK